MKFLNEETHAVKFAIVSNFPNKLVPQDNFFQCTIVCIVRAV